MCSIEEGFKLCTCGKLADLSREKITWELRKFNADKEAMVRKGKIAFRKMTEQEKIQEEEVGDFILSELNTRNCFDIEIAHGENDYLTIHIKEEKHTSYHYRYIEDKWTQYNGSPFKKWKSQLENYKKGYVQ